MVKKKGVVRRSRRQQLMFSKSRVSANPSLVFHLAGCPPKKGLSPPSSQEDPRPRGSMEVNERRGDERELCTPYPR
ncbi:hypothetical protein D5086_026526 [Populus alba]|uniref:Uncharacterized protein n=1 Tax=Populus alba TaxID=43335 RepID=A0ACC4B236_POPAL